MDNQTSGGSVIVSAERYAALERVAGVVQRRSVDTTNMPDAAREEFEADVEVLSVRPALGWPQRLPLSDLEESREVNLKEEEEARIALRNMLREPSLRLTADEQWALRRASLVMERLRLSLDAAHVRLGSTTEE